MVIDVVVTEMGLVILRSILLFGLI